MSESSGLVSYLNGRLVPHSRAAGQIGIGRPEQGGGVATSERTFKGSIYRLREHLETLYKRLDSASLDPGLTIDDMESATVEVLDANKPNLGENEDVIVQQVVRVEQTSESEAPSDVSVAISVNVIQFTAFAEGYLDGVTVLTPSTYAVPAQRTGGARRPPEPFALLEDAKGNVTECRGATFLFVSNGRIMLPNQQNSVDGSTLQTVVELAESLEVPIDEGDYSPYDVYMADEAFLSGPGFCILPVASLNGLKLGEEVPGAVTDKLVKAWSKSVEFDFVQQALDQLGKLDTTTITLE